MMWSTPNAKFVVTFVYRQNACSLSIEYCINIQIIMKCFLSISAHCVPLCPQRWQWRRWRWGWRRLGQRHWHCRQLCQFNVRTHTHTARTPRTHTHAAHTHTLSESVPHTCCLSQLPHNAAPSALSRTLLCKPNRRSITHTTWWPPKKALLHKVASRQARKGSTGRHRATIKAAQRWQTPLWRHRQAAPSDVGRQWQTKLATKTQNTIEYKNTTKATLTHGHIFNYLNK